MLTPKIWIAIGFLGQGFFFCRFLVQWIASERRKRSVVPTAFWFFSIGGGLILLSYAIHRQDPVFIAGQALGLAIYGRNLYFIFRNRREAGEGGEGGNPGDAGNGAGSPDPGEGEQA